MEAEKKVEAHHVKLHQNIRDRNWQQRLIDANKEEEERKFVASVKKQLEEAAEAERQRRLEQNREMKQVLVEVEQKKVDELTLLRGSMKSELAQIQENARLHDEELQRRSEMMQTRL